MVYKFRVLDIINRKSTIMDFEEVCLKYPEANLTLLKEEVISVVSIFKDGKKIALINKIEGINNA